jgi:polar amino acid transport system ATP-binding protein
MNWLEQPDRGEVRISGQRLGIDDASGKAMSHKELSKIRERVGWCSRALTCGRI